jgi:hypothetical protein
MSITVLIARKDIESTVQRYGCADYTVTPFDWKAYSPSYADSTRDDVLFTFAKGRVVAERERNMTDDSDFYATYMTDAGQFIEIMYGTTRGWSYANGSNIDAIREVEEAYENHVDRVTRHRHAQARWNERNRRWTAIREAGITMGQYKRLKNVYGGSNDMGRIMKLLRTKVRSGFKKSLVAQIRGWLDAPTPKYNTPLSPKQLEYLV